MRTARGSAALLVAGVVVAFALMPAGSNAAGGPDVPSGGTTSASPTPRRDGTVTLLDDGSTADTGPQPAQPTVAKLKPGEKPPQFVVFSWAGAQEDDGQAFSHLRAVAKANDARMTFFLRGIDLLPSSKRSLYQPPQHEPGTAAVAFPTETRIRATLTQVGQAWLDGDEIGSGFNGRICGAKGGRDWSTAEWESEIDQATSFVRFWKTDTGFTDDAPLPFDYQHELAGGSAPCLEGQQNLLPAEREFGWRYDASSSTDSPQWPIRIDGLWNFPLQRLPYPADESRTRDALLSAFDRAYHGSRAPLLIGNSTPSGGYQQALEDVMKNVCHQPDVRCVSFRQLADWLDAQ